ncbi:MAG TPA: hypothetical protein VML01_13455 [Bryobacterales bacterium]|nr:hypothetical protein [Bryobacterales bacterium]
MPPASSSGVRDGRFLYLPVVPGRLEFARWVRDEILREKPPVIAVDLPVTLEAVYDRAVERLPELSVIIYDDQEADRAVYETVEPADPFVEALRTAREVKAKTVFLDPDVAERSPAPDSYPDTYAAERIGIEKYVETYRKMARGKKGDLTVQAEGLAYRLQNIGADAEVVVVVSLKLLDPLLQAMKHKQVQPLRKVERKGARLLNLHPDCLAEVLTEIPFLQSVYEARRNGPPAPAAPIETRQVRGFSLIGAPHEDPKEGAIARAAQKPLDRQRLHLDLFRATERVYEKNTGESVTLWQRRLWSRYSRNLAVTQGQLLSSLFELTVAARSVIDDNMAWEMWEMAGTYSAQKIQTDLATVKLSGEHMWLDTRRIRLRRRLPRKKARMRPAGLKGRKRENVPGEWRKEWTGFSICSYPPEDLVIENYGLFLKKKGKSILSEERTHTEPFSTSLLDGIDLRETLRNWHEKRIYVRSQQRVSGEVGAIVMIFDEDRDNRYSYCLSWLGEHQNESDMAFYATDPFENIVGPGIGRSEYGGLLLTLPSGRLMDVWHDPDYMFAESKPERLLLAGLDYSLEKFVVYVAAKPPRSIYRSIAAHMGVKIIYIPIGQLSPVALKKVRVMHVLDGHDKRAIAKDYVW